MAATKDNHWEFKVERNLPLKRWHAYRVAVERIEEWWWHPSSRPVSYIYFNPEYGAGGRFEARVDSTDLKQELFVLKVISGWTFSLTDAFDVGLRPANPSMVGIWDFSSAKHGFVPYTATIRHFSEGDYRRNMSLGLERGWNQAADKLVELCEEGIAGIERTKQSRAARALLVQTLPEGPLRRRE